MAEKVWTVRDDEGVPDGPLVGIGYLMTTTFLDDGDRRRYEWAYDCGCAFMKLRSESHSGHYLDLSEVYCSAHQEKEPRP